MGVVMHRLHITANLRQNQFSSQYHAKAAMSSARLPVGVSGRPRPENESEWRLGRVLRVGLTKPYRISNVLSRFAAPASNMNGWKLLESECSSSTVALGLAHRSLFVIF
jgi:hypothetical protein